MSHVFSECSTAVRRAGHTHQAAAAANRYTLARRCSALVLWALVGLACVDAQATFITEIENNNTRLTATAVPDSAFDVATTLSIVFRNATNNPAAPTFRTAALRGVTSTVSDVDFFSFAGSAGEQIYVDADNDPAILCSSCTIDGAMVLFNSNGAILAVGDNMLVQDSGSGLRLDPFIGVFTLPTTDTYFLAVVSGPLIVNISAGSTFSALTRPDGSEGGFAVNGSAANSDQFGPGQFAGGYLVFISRSGAAMEVPEPATLPLIALAVIGLAIIRSRPESFHRS